MAVAREVVWTGGRLTLGCCEQTFLPVCLQRWRTESSVSILLQTQYEQVCRCLLSCLKQTNWCSWESELRPVPALVPILPYLRCCVEKAVLIFSVAFSVSFGLFPFPLRAAIWFSGSECTSRKDRNGEQVWNISLLKSFSKSLGHLHLMCESS